MNSADVVPVYDETMRPESSYGNLRQLSYYTIKHPASFAVSCSQWNPVHWWWK